MKPRWPPRVTLFRQCYLIGVVFLCASSSDSERWSVPCKRSWATPLRRPQSGKAEAGDKLFAQHCAKCHGADGKGNPNARKLYSDIPDFSDAKFQRGRTDTQLLTSIFDGKCDGMPGFKGKITNAQAQELEALRMAFWHLSGFPRQGFGASAIKVARSPLPPTERPSEHNKGETNPFNTRSLSRHPLLAEIVHVSE
jgi:hypothetical protein